jgi:hypothetical protein
LFKRGQRITDDARTSRFAFENSKIRRAAGIAHPRLFEVDDTLGLSISLTEGLSEDPVWHLGDIAGKNRGKKAIARADISTTAIATHTKLSCVHDVPPRRHALMVGWPSADLEQRKNIAQVLASKAKLVTRDA